MAEQPAWKTATFDHCVATRGGHAAVDLPADDHLVTARHLLSTTRVPRAATPVLGEQAHRACCPRGMPVVLAIAAALALSLTVALALVPAGGATVVSRRRSAWGTGSHLDAAREAPGQIWGVQVGWIPAGFRQQSRQGEYFRDPQGPRRDHFEVRVVYIATEQATMSVRALTRTLPAHAPSSGTVPAAVKVASDHEGGGPDKGARLDNGNRPGAGGRPGPATYGIAVRRGPSVDLAAEVAGALDTGWKTAQPAAVGGHAAFLLGTEIDGHLSYSLRWSPAPGLVLSVGGGRPDDVTRIAAHLVVERVPLGPTDAVEARRSVEMAVQACLSGAGMRDIGGAAGLVVARVTPVVFLNATEAMAGYELRDPTSPAENFQVGTTVSGVMDLAATPSGWRPRACPTSRASPVPGFPGAASRYRAASALDDHGLGNAGSSIFESVEHVSWMPPVG